MFRKFSELKQSSVFKEFALYTELRNFEAYTAYVDVRLFAGFQEITRAIQASKIIINSLQAATTSSKARESGAGIVETDFAATRSYSRTAEFKTSSLGVKISSVRFTASLVDILDEF